ncbi:MAG TPA: hypothetical protein VGW98_06235 [Solirubrobacteraceae bacterium]|nr:hypothetical protein [Solirubrobacteraceae bacterium]
MTRPICAGLLLPVLVAATTALVAAAPATAGRYTVVSCPGDDGWSQDTPNAQFVTYEDGCAGTMAGGLTLALGPNPDGPYVTNSEGAITFAVPPGLSIASYRMRLRAEGAPCGIVNNQCANGFGAVWVNHTGQADPDYDYRNLGYGSQTVEVGPTPPLSGVGWVDVGVGCDGGPGGYDCPGSQAGSPEAAVEVISADFVIASSASPAASGFTGSLLDPGAHGVAELQFTAADPGGPGVYTVTLQVDSGDVYNATPDGNGGACAAIGTYADGSWEFESRQPCRQTETVDVPVDTTRLADGTHTLKVIVTDAAQNSSVVYDDTITTANRTTVSALLSSPLSASLSLEPAYAIMLDDRTTALGKNVRRSFEHSALTLSGELRNPAGVAAPGVPVSLLAQEGIQPSGPVGVLAQTTTDGAGEWALHAPRGPSRLLRIVSGQGAQGASARAGVGIGETVSPTLGLRVRTPGGARLVFSGRLAITPLGSPRPLVLIETRAGREWQAVGHAIRVTANGTYSYRYASSPLTLGRRFAFRAVTPATSLWQSGSSPVREAVVR